MPLNRPTHEGTAAVSSQLERSLKLLVGFRNRLYRETGMFPDDLAAAIHRVEFVLRDLFTGLVTPAKTRQTTERPTITAPPAGSGRPN